jgi:site-specific DNA recombinase
MLIDLMDVTALRGGTWCSERIAAIIKNEKYAGNALLQKKYVTNHLTKALVWNKGVLPMYYAENTHPPIIDSETFQKAQDIMAKSRVKNAGQKATSPYPFTGKIFCSCCGKNYKRKTNKTQISWNCSTYLWFGKEVCHAKQIPEDILLSLTAEVLGLQSFDETVFVRHIKEIQVPEFNKLVFVFFSGSLVERSWQDKA